MARKLRIQYPGAIYHVMNRGDHQERIFCDDEDRKGFLAAWAEGCDKTGWQIHSYCLMANHVHLVIETPHANLVEGMKWLLGVYTARFNRRHKVFGHLFSGRYKALIVDGSGNGYLKSHPFKVDLAAKLRAETTVSVSWIAQRLAMGTRGHLAHLLYLKAHPGAERQPSNQPGLEI